MRNASAGMEDWKYLVAGTTVIYSREVIYSTNYEDSANQAIFCSSGISEGLLQWQEVIHTRASFGGGGANAPWIWLAPLGYAEDSILHVNLL